MSWRWRRSARCSRSPLSSARSEAKWRSIMLVLLLDDAAPDGQGARAMRARRGVGRDGHLAVAALLGAAGRVALVQPANPVRHTDPEPHRGEGLEDHVHAGPSLP